MESIPISANVEFTLTVFRSRIPAKKFLVLKDADLLLQVQLEIEEQSTGGTGLSDVRGRTKQQDEGNYMRRFIKRTLLTKKNIYI